MRVACARSVPSFLAACALLCCTTLPALAVAWEPEGNLGIVVADGPRDSTDRLARLVRSAINQNKLLDVNTVVLGKSGGNGVRAFLDLKLARGNAHKLVIGTNNVYLLSLVARLDYQQTDLTSVATVAEDDFILWTYQAAPQADAAAFLADLRKSATGMRFSGSQSRDVDQTLSLLLDEQVGGEPTYVSFKSGSEAFIQLADRHITANPNDPAENLSQWRGGQVRPFCVLSHERMIYTAKAAAEQSWADIPTCYEQGLGIDQYHFPHIVFLPGGVSDRQCAFCIELVRKINQTDEFRDCVERLTLAPTFLTDEDLMSYIEKDRQRVIPLFQEAGWFRQ